jgi:hypothetical protein
MGVFLASLARKLQTLEGAFEARQQCFGAAQACCDCGLLLQVSVELQDMDADPTSVQRGFIAAYGWSDYLWKGILAKLPAAKAAKTDGSGDFKLVMQALVAGRHCLASLSGPLGAGRFLGLWAAWKQAQHMLQSRYQVHRLNVGQAKRCYCSLTALT